jgi:PilZ domain
MERRRHQRYDLEAALSFAWKDLSGVRKSAEGFLRDISGGGVFVWTDDLPLRGVDVRFEVRVRSVLPSSQLVIQGKGQVLRVEVGLTPNAPTGFSASVATFTLCNENADLVN